LAFHAEDRHVILVSEKDNIKLRKKIQIKESETQAFTHTYKDNANEGFNANTKDWQTT